jgi:hypothetical protein
MPATYEVNGRQYIAVPVAAGTGQFAARFGGPAPQGRGAPPAAAPAPAAGQAPEAQGARQGGAGAAGAGRGGRGGGRGAAGPTLPAQYMVFALPQ